MAKLRSSGETALRARDLRQQARQLEAEARSSVDDATYRETMERAAKLKDQAMDMERASRWFAYMDQMPMVGAHKGTQPKTVERINFLNRVAESHQTRNRDAVATQAVSAYSKDVRALWVAHGKTSEQKRESLRVKILNFMRNNSW